MQSTNHIINSEAVPMSLFALSLFGLLGLWHLAVGTARSHAFSQLVTTTPYTSHCTLTNSNHKQKHATGTARKHAFSQLVTTTSHYTLINSNPKTHTPNRSEVVKMSLFALSLLWLLGHWLLAVGTAREHAFPQLVTTTLYTSHNPLINPNHKQPHKHETGQTPCSLNPTLLITPSSIQIPKHTPQTGRKL
jgi:hypothetical protein